MCSVENCRDTLYAKGFCLKHYRKFKKYGDPLAGRVYNKNKRYCLVADCKNDGDFGGYCFSHYSKIRKYGDPLVGVMYEKGGICCISGCGKQTSGKGLCSKHYDEKYRKDGKQKISQRKYQKTEKARQKGLRNYHTRRARQLGVDSEKFNNIEIFERDKWTCSLCGKAVNKRLKYPDPKSPSLDHIIPLSRGGGHTRNNVQLAHLHCNLVKSNKLPDELNKENRL